MRSILFLAALPWFSIAADLPAQSEFPRAEDVASPEAIVLAGYAAHQHQHALGGVGPRHGAHAAQGFVEEQIAIDLEVYGDIAQAFSTYQKHVWESDEIQGRGINSFSLVRNDGRWWIASVAWDEEVGAGPVPDEYLP